MEIKSTLVLARRSSKSLGTCAVKSFRNVA